MMGSPSELSLECKPHSHTMLLKSFGEQIDQTQKLEDFLARLEEERLKIDAFKRELPLCMQLLTNAMEASRQQLISFRMTNNNHGGNRPVLEEFIPLKHGSHEGSSSSDKFNNNNGANNIVMSDNKANWMTSAQLWSQASDATNKQQSSAKDSDIGVCSNSIVSPKLALDNKHRNGGVGGGAFLPFSKDRSSSSSSCHISPSLRPALPELALSNSIDKVMEDKKSMDIMDHARREENISSSANKGGSINATAVSVADQQGKVAASSQAAAVAECQSTITSTTTNNNTITATTTTTTNTTSQTHRKARRCWSPDLHRRFVNALQMLGGSQVATPKQIRELMKVDGLTNDEVKSHLQKYRLHTRRPSPTPQATAEAGPRLVVLGSIWVPPEYATAAHGGAPATLYGAHPTTHASAHYCAPPVPQEFYPAPTPPVPQPAHHHHHHQQLHHQLLHHQLHMYKTPSQAHSSPESDALGNGGRSESIEDGKSESSSWKADSEHGGDKKVLMLREDGDDSNGSEITLKF